MATLTGWGRGTWGEGAWGTSLPVTLSTAGVITSAVGSVTIVAEANVTPVSPAITSAVGAPQVVAGAVVQVTGLSISSAVGSEGGYVASNRYSII